MWVPTPIPVVVKAFGVMEKMGLLGSAGPRGIVIDAGTGDGSGSLLFSPDSTIRDSSMGWK